MGVIGRTSAMTYKHSRTTIGQIGDDLAVDYVVEGSVRRDGNKLRVTAQVVQVLNETRVWAQSYDREMIDLLELEREVAAEIARHVGVSITIDQAAKPNLPHIPIARLNESYLQGRYNWYKRTEAGWKTGEEYFGAQFEKTPIMLPRTQACGVPCSKKRCINCGFEGDFARSETLARRTRR